MLLEALLGGYVDGEKEMEMYRSGHIDQDIRSRHIDQGTRATMPHRQRSAHSVQPMCEAVSSPAHRRKPHHYCPPPSTRTPLRCFLRAHARQDRPDKTAHTSNPPVARVALASRASQRTPTSPSTNPPLI